MEKREGRKRHVPWECRAVTHFYPLYGEGRDWVTPVEPVIRTQFQEVIPYYYLSSSETRDKGVGPMLEEQPESCPIKKTRMKHPFIKTSLGNKTPCYKETIYDLFV